MMIKKNKLTSPLFSEDADKKNAERQIEFLQKMRKHPTFSFAIFALVLVMMQILSKAGLVSSSFVTAIGTTVIFCIVALGFCLLLGYSALASLGTAGFIGIGAYSAYYCLVEWDLTIGIAFVVAILAAFVIGIIVGYISLRIEGIYLAIVTLGVAQIIKEVLSAISDTIKIKGADLTLFGNEAIKLKTDHVFYILVGIMFVLMVITQNLMNSPTGRAMLAMKNSTAAAQAMGISLIKYRLMAFVICTAYASLTGVLLMMVIRSADATDPTGYYALITSLNILAAVIIGGYKSVWGAVVGTFIMYGIKLVVFNQIPFFAKNPLIITLVSGVLVIVIVMFYPGGLAQLLVELKGKLKVYKKKMKEAKYGKDLG